MSEPTRTLRFTDGSAVVVSAQVWQALRERVADLIPILDAYNRLSAEDKANLLAFAAQSHSGPATRRDSTTT